jgi:hypothetical protein
MSYTIHPGVDGVACMGITSSAREIAGDDT